MHRVIVLLFLAGSLAASPSRAEEDADLERSKRYFEQGKRAIEDGRFAVAIAALEEAQRLAPRPSTTFGLATACRLQYAVDRDPEKLLRAVTLLRQVVREAPEDDERRGKAAVLLADLEPEVARIDEQRRREGKDALAQAQAAAPQTRTQLLVSSVVKGSVIAIDGGEARSAPLVVDVTPGPHLVHGEAKDHFSDEREGVAVEGRLVDIELSPRAKPGLIAFRVTPGASITVDDIRMGETPVTRGIPVAAGTHSVVLTLRGHGFHAAEIVVPPDHTVLVAATLPRTTQRLVSYWLGGGTVAVAAAGAATTWLAMAARWRAEDIEARHNAGLTSKEVVAHDDDVRQNDALLTASYVAWAGAAVLGIAAGITYFADIPAPQSERPALAPMLGKGVIGASISLELDLP